MNYITDTSASNSSHSILPAQKTKNVAFPYIIVKALNYQT